MKYKYKRIPQFSMVLNDGGVDYVTVNNVKEKYQYIETSAHPFDDVFKSLKIEHIRLFIPLINAFFGTKYSLDENIELLPSDGVALTPTIDGTVNIKGRTLDMLARIGGKTYIIECQSYPDSSMVIRMAEYALMGALRNAKYEDGVYYIDLPRYAIVYVRSNSNTPRTTRIRVCFPSGEEVDYDSDNIIMKDITKEEIVERKMYALVPFYILRYEQDIKEGKADIATLEEEIRYFSEHLDRDTQAGMLETIENRDIKYLSNNLIRKVFGTNDVESAERLVNVMGGNVVWMPSIAEREGRKEGERIGEARGISQLAEAFRLLKYGECTTVEDLVAKGISLEAAEVAVRI